MEGHAKIMGDSPAESHSTTTAFKLGDFSSLNLKCRPSPLSAGARPSPGKDLNATSGTSLGNFSRIFDIFEKTKESPIQSRPALSALEPRADTSRLEKRQLLPGAPTKTTCAKATPDEVDSSLRPKHQQGLIPPELCESSDSAFDVPSDAETLEFYETPATSSSGSPSQDKAITVAAASNLYYQLQRNGPVSFLTESTLSKNHLPSLLDPNSRDRYWSIWAEDQYLKTTSPAIYENGLHVFLDVSNIHISFLQTLKNKLNLAATARFTPNPTFNMAALTDFITRERPVKCLTAGCSVLPDKPQPSFIEVLRKLDYRVDVRDRKKTLEPKNHQKESSKESFLPREARYVEDYVDETLQTRIGETVMQCFGNEGTLVLVTGDAKPAPYSDGFFAYADRALTMGWHVEVICWRICCSSTWKDPAWICRWGSRFRLIELDFLLNDLWLKE